MAINAFSNLSINISDGGTVPSLDYLSSKTYINIGSGNVLKVSWNTPTALNNTVDTYIVHVLGYSNESNGYKPLYTTDVGNVNEFYLNSSVLNSVQQTFLPLHIYVEAISKYGPQYNGLSNTEVIYVCRGTGTYVKVEEGYAQPIMKRAVAFTKLSYNKLVDSSGVIITGIDGTAMGTKVSDFQDIATGWTLMQEFYSKDVHDTWHLNDLSYEVLMDENGEIITDANDDTIYVL